MMTIVSCDRDSTDHRACLWSGDMGGNRLGTVRRLENSGARDRFEALCRLFRVQSNFQAFANLVFFGPQRNWKGKVLFES